MADFCTKCAPEFWGGDIDPDIDIDKIYESLNPTEYEIVLCEGCCLSAVGKTEEYELLLAVPCEEVDENNNPVMNCITWLTREEFMALPSKI
jgi:hypothetical protein